MIDRVSVAVGSLETAARFYEALLGTLGLTKLVVRERTLGFGKRYPEFWINLRSGMTPVEPAGGAHVCLRAPSKAAVDAFHRAAIAHGGADDGAPGPRPHDTPG